MFSAVTKSMKVLHEVYEDTRQLVHNMINCDKPIIAAVNGVAVLLTYHRHRRPPSYTVPALVLFG